MDKFEILDIIKDGLTSRQAMIARSKVCKSDPEMKVTVDGTPNDCEMIIEINEDEWFVIKAEKHTNE